MAWCVLVVLWCVSLLFPGDGCKHQFGGFEFGLGGFDSWGLVVVFVNDLDGTSHVEIGLDSGVISLAVDVWAFGFEQENQQDVGVFADFADNLTVPVDVLFSSFNGPSQGLFF